MMARLLSVWVLGMLMIMSAGDCDKGPCVQVFVEWNDNNLRLTRLIVENGTSHNVAIQARDENNVVLLTNVYAPGTTMQNIPGSASRRVVITEVAPGDYEIELIGVNLDMLDPAPDGLPPGSQGAFLINK